MEVHIGKPTHSGTWSPGQISRGCGSPNRSPAKVSLRTLGPIGGRAWTTGPGACAWTTGPGARARRTRVWGTFALPGRGPKSRDSRKCKGPLVGSLLLLGVVSTRAQVGACGPCRNVVGERLICVADALHAATVFSCFFFFLFCLCECESWRTRPQGALVGEHKPSPKGETRQAELLARRSRTGGDA